MKKVFTGLMMAAVAAMAIEVGVPPKLVLNGANGGKTDGSSWSSQTLKGKVHVLFYVDPDEKDLNEPLVQALKKRHFDRKKYGTVAVINLAATWKPNVIIEALLKKKQKEFPVIQPTLKIKKVYLLKSGILPITTLTFWFLTRVES